MESLWVIVLTSLLAVSGTALPVKNSSRELRIIGGKETEIEDVPYQAVLISSGRPFCGGSIISEKFVLSAAHCCVDTLDEVRVGSKYTSQGGTLVKIKKITIYPDYDDTNDSGGQYDLCVVETESQIPFSKKVQPIKIGENKLKPNIMAKAAGWGVTDSGAPSKVLLSVRLPVVSDSYCQRFYPKMPLSSKTVCAGDTKVNVCFGDSGGGLTYNGKLYGVVSCGTRSCRTPAVFATTTDPDQRQFIKSISGV